MSLPMYISGYRAEKIDTLIKSNLTRVVLVDDGFNTTYTTADMYNTYLKDTFKDNLVSGLFEYNPNETYGLNAYVADTNGIYVKSSSSGIYVYDSSASAVIDEFNKIPIASPCVCYSIKNIVKPKYIHIAWRGFEYSNRYLTAGLRFIGQTTGNMYYPIVFNDARIATGSGAYTTIDNGRIYYPWSNTSWETGNTTFNVDTDLTNCFLDDELYIFEYINTHRILASNGSTYPSNNVYFSKLIIES